MKFKSKNKKYVVTETMVFIEDYVSYKITLFNNQCEAQCFYEKRKDEIEEEILSTGSFRGYCREDFDVAEHDNELDFDKVVLIYNKPQTESIFTMGVREMI